MTTRAKPGPRERYAHFVTITTRLMDNDIYNHVNNATYYSFIDTAVTSFETGLFRNDEPLAAAQGWFVQVTCDRSTQRPIDMPPRVREALEAIRMP
jgi:acyl-CoA thioester hydrolase